ncbi:winged helix-turn-helix domain-containing protein [Enterococcus sp. AZ196]|uniref:winged helix-turn-helix domain-containing protein n=1 Tax=Enterococcus sp. AZ196 TaxID=2774659 RepID=UPI003D2915ED
MNILILSNNPSSDKRLLQQLIRLGHEVFCSHDTLKLISTQSRYRRLFSHFEVIIFSESVSNWEIHSVWKHLPLKNYHKVFRRTDLINSDDCLFKEVMGEENENQFSLINLPIKDSLENLREKINEAEAQGYDNEKFPFQNLSKRESQVFRIIKDSNDAIVSREYICKQIWGGEERTSQFSQLSNIVKRLNSKIEELEEFDWRIETIWGKGYKISESYKRS